MSLPTIPQGTRFGELTVSSGPFSLRTKPNRSKGRGYTCLCSCGNTKDILGYVLLARKVSSCGCQQLSGLPLSHEKHVTHGGARKGKHTPEYLSWTAMKARCRNPNHVGYANYGGRGIKVCDEWSDFAAFLRDMGPRPFPDASIERKDNDLGYFADNCFWATKKEQARNKRNNVAVVRDDGVIFGTITEAAESAGVSRRSLSCALSGKTKSSGGRKWSYALTNRTPDDEVGNG